MGQTTDFEQVRRRRRFLRNIRRFIIFLMILTAAAGIFLFREDIANLGLKTRLDDWLIIFGSGGGYPTDSPGGEIIGMEQVGGCVAVLNDTNVYLYNDRAKQIRSIQHKENNPVMECSDSRIMIYDRGGMSLTVESLSTNLFQKTFDYSIAVADMNDRGYFAVATGSQMHVSRVTMYNQQFEEIFNWFSAEKYVNALSVSPRGDMLAVGCVDARGGQMVSSVYLFKTSMEEPVFTYEIVDGLIYSLQLRGDGLLHILTDQQAISLNGSGKEVGVYDFDGRTLSAFAGSERMTVLALGNFMEDRSVELVSLDNRCAEQGTYTLTEQILSIRASGNRVYVLTENTLRYFDNKLDLAEKLTMNEAQRVLPVGGQLYYLTGREFNRISLS